MENEYWARAGIWNRIALEWFYLNVGLNTFNDFKYAAALVIGIYLANKYLIVAIIAALLILPALIILGRIKIKHISKRMDWLNVVHGTHFTKKTYDIQEQILEELKKLNAK